MPSIEVMTELGRVVRDTIKAQIPVRRFGRLREGIRMIATRDRVTIFSIYYWTRARVDGRGNVYPRVKRMLAWFTNPRKDPRIRQNYPRQAKQVERLGSFLNRRQMRNLVKRGQLIVRMVAGPADGFDFITEGVRLSRQKVPAAVRKRILTDVRRNVRRRSKTSITVNL